MFGTIFQQQRSIKLLGQSLTMWYFLMWRADICDFSIFSASMKTKEVRSLIFRTKETRKPSISWDSSPKVWRNTPSSWGSEKKRMRRKIFVNFVLYELRINPYEIIIYQPKLYYLRLYLYSEVKYTFFWSHNWQIFMLEVVIFCVYLQSQSMYVPTYRRKITDTCNMTKT